jgi:hypothetical protein
MLFKKITRKWVRLYAILAGVIYENLKDGYSGY